MLDTSDLLCDNNVPCMTKMNKLYNKRPVGSEDRDNIPYMLDPTKIYNSNYGDHTSLTHLGGLSGAPDTDLNFGYRSSGVGTPFTYGAEIVELNDYPKPYYDVTVSQLVYPGWLGERQEATFMNRLKVLNEPEVKAYRDLKLYPVPDQQYETYEPIINTQEYSYPMPRVPCNVSDSTCPNNYSDVIEAFNIRSGTELDVRSPIDTNVGVGFLFKIMIIVLVFVIIYYIFKQRS